MGQHQYFVYEYSYPQEMPDPLRAGVIFYVGKATNGARLDHHLAEAKTDCSCAKCQAIRLVWDAGLTVIRRIVFESINNTEVVNEERRRILLHESPYLTNVVKTRRKYEPKEVQSEIQPIEEVRIFCNKHGMRINPIRQQEEFEWIDQQWQEHYNDWTGRGFNLEETKEHFFFCIRAFASSTTDGYIDLWDELFEERYNVESDPSTLR